MKHLTAQEVLGIEKQLKLLIEKNNRVRAALAIETDAGQEALIRMKMNKLREALMLSTDVAVQFKYEQEIADLEEQLRKLRG